MTQSAGIAAVEKSAPPAKVRVVNLNRYQHYSERRPPWVKVHRMILDSYSFAQLDDATKWLAIGLVLLASESNNSIPADPQWIQNRLLMKSLPNLAALLSSGFIESCSDASTAQAQLQTETEIEEEQQEDAESDADEEAVDTGTCAGAHASAHETGFAQSKSATLKHSVDRPKKRRGRKPADATGVAGFEEFWQARPVRIGADPRALALAAYRARLAEGVSPKELLDGIRRYATFCEATIKPHDRHFIKMTSTFLSPATRGWEEKWATPDASARPDGGSILDEV